MDRDAFHRELQRELDEEVGALLSRVRMEGEELLHQARSDSERREREARRRLEEELDLRRRRHLARIDLDTRNALLRLKQEQIEHVFERARSRLDRMKREDSDSYCDLMLRIFRSCRAIFPPGPLHVKLGDNLESLAALLSGEEGVEVSRQVGGAELVLEAPDGRLTCDGSAVTILDRLRREREAEVAALLFGETDDD